MQTIVIDKPYRFVPPYTGRFWIKALANWLPRSLKRNYGIAATEFRGTEHLQQSLAAGHGIILAPNHCRPCDPLVLGQMCQRINHGFHCMASWHLFKQGRVQAWLLRRIGGFSVYREGIDRESLKTAINILVEARRPLIIFPEGMVSRANDRLRTFQEGLTFLARTSARQRAKTTPPGQVVVHPIALRYFFEGDLAASIGPVLAQIEQRLSWRPQSDLPLVERISKVGEALLSLKEIEYMGQVQTGPLKDRLSALIERLLLPLEKEWLGGHSEPAVFERIKRLRTSIVAEMVTGGITEQERARRWRQLADIYLAQAVSCYPDDYLCTRLTAERLLETVERFEEDLTDKARIHRPLRVVIEVGEALPVSAGRDKDRSADPLLRQLAERLQTMLDRLAAESPVWSAP